MLLAPAAAIALGLAVPALAPAAEGETATTTQTPTTSVPAPAPEAPPTTTTTPTTSTGESPPPAEPVQEPQVSGQQSQGSSANPSSGPKAHIPKGSTQGSAGGTTAEPGAAANGKRAASPSALTPALPLQFQTSFSGIPTFFIESFQVPPFLLPIFQAAGTAYGIPWQVLAAINEVETDYGRDLSVSSAGAEGWMQFLPAEWAQYGVDANGDGFKDPYNPADAIFAAARYLKAAGGDANIRAAVYSYNHSPAYVDSVMLRAQLLGGTPSELLGAITGITQARFPVHAAAHFSDGFPSVLAGASATPKTIPGTTIYSDPGAPVIAVQDGEIVGMGSSPTLGHYISLRDAYGNTYTYAQLGDLSSVYPLLQPRSDSAVSSRITGRRGSGEAPPSGPASAGAQPRSPLSESGTVSGLALGASAGIEGAAAKNTAPLTPAAARPAPAPPTENVRVFNEGSETVYLRPLVPGVQVIAGTVLGHVGSEGAGSSAPAAPHVLFQIRPAGAGAPLIDPKPILDGWVALENTSVFHARGKNPFLATSPTVGQVLLESKQQLQPQVLHDSSISLSSCARDDIGAGRIDKRVLAMLEYLSVSGMSVSVAGVPCAAAQPASTGEGNAVGNLQITEVNGVPVAGHQGPGTVADTLVRKLLMMQGLTRPREVVSLMSYPGERGAKTSRGAADAIHVIYTPPAGTLAQAASAFNLALSPHDWSKLIARLGEIPDPVVGRGPSSAAIPVSPHEAGAEGGGGGHN
jgi:murein DD-endopeptidase MepM/ murein hydrolase activator NlpD